MTKRKPITSHCSFSFDDWHSDWRDEQPNDAYGRQDCLELMRWNSGVLEWNDEECADFNNFICEFVWNVMFLSNIKNYLRRLSKLMIWWISYSLKILQIWFTGDLLCIDLIYVPPNLLIILFCRAYVLSPRPIRWIHDQHDL